MVWSRPRPDARSIRDILDGTVDRQAALANLADETPPAPPDPAVVRELLATLPLHGDDLRALPTERLRELLESLHLAIRYTPRSILRR